MSCIFGTKHENLTDDTHAGDVSSQRYKVLRFIMPRFTITNGKLVWHTSSLIEMLLYIMFHWGCCYFVLYSSGVKVSTLWKIYMPIRHLHPKPTRVALYYISFRTVRLLIKDLMRSLGGCTFIWETFIKSYYCTHDIPLNYEKGVNNIFAVRICVRESTI